MFKNPSEIKICVVGLGYVGLPLAVEFGKKYPTIGFDINRRRIHRLKTGIDDTMEVEAEELKNSALLSFSFSHNDLVACNVFIVTVPTPIDSAKKPDLAPLKAASEIIGSVLARGDVIIYESTVYPGVTEDECAPILERISGLTLNEDIFIGYSPERINPGDRQHRLQSIIKVVSGSTPEATVFIDKLYSSIIKAGTHKVTSIRVAEAAKVIENTQRDINIALMNELSIIFEKLNIDTEEVLRAAGTKWNFLNFRPGLVGGHCIGVDPYYLTHKAEALGYHPQLILAGRRLNDGMGVYAAQRMVKTLIHKNIKVNNSRILILGLTFKENCPDLRNTKVLDLICELQEFGLWVDVFDPWCSSIEAENKYHIQMTESPRVSAYDGIIIAVAHECFREMGIERVRSFCKTNHVIFDLKSLFPVSKTDTRL